MDLQNIVEAHCAVCFELFGENSKCPRMLPCGHSFCHSCLETLLVQSPTCPNCKHGIQFPNVDCIPVNYILKSVISRLNVTTPDSSSLMELNTVINSDFTKEPKKKSEDSLALKKELSSEELPYEGYCEDHHICKHLRCMDCECWVCGVCATLSHKLCRTVLVAEALKELKQGISLEVETEIETQNSKSRNLDKFLKDLEGKRMSLKNEIKKLQFELRSKIEALKSYGESIEELQLMKSARKKHCEKLKLLETFVEETTNNDQLQKAKNKLNEFLIQARKLEEELTIPRFSHCHLSLEILRVWSREGSSVYATRCQNGINQYGQVVVKGDRVWVYCFKAQFPKQKDVIISFRKLLITFSGSSVLPRRGFLKVENYSLNLSDVIITTDDHTPRAKNFLLLCSGIIGRSYEAKWFKQGTLRPFSGSLSVKIIGFENGKPVYKGIRGGGVYERKKRKGFLSGAITQLRDSLEYFYILIEDESTEKLPDKFGFVEEEFDVCERIDSYNISNIKHCGLII